MAILKIQPIKKYLPDGFISGILLMILMAYLFPGIGGEGSAVRLDTIEEYGIMLLFFFYGLRLNPRNLRYDLKNWRLHLLIQCITFIAFPVVVLIFYPFFKGSAHEILWLAVFFLAALPSTVSSSVVMVSIARGNIPSAIFNASISGVIGILITPAWMGLFMGKQSEAFAIGESINDLVVRILLPVFVGLALHRFLGAWAARNSRYISLFDKAVILCIVYNSFSNSFLSGIFASIALHELLILSGSVIALFFLVFEGTRILGRYTRFNREDQITLLFCGSKKSLIHGSVMSSVLFAGTAYISIFLVPVMIYHAFQLFYISILAHRYSHDETGHKKISHE